MQESRGSDTVQGTPESRGDSVKQALRASINTVVSDKVWTPVLCEISTFPRRFTSKVRVDQVSGCWNWISSTGGAPGFPQHVYGRYWPNATTRFCQIAHRFAYEFATLAKIPAGLELDHRCENKLCVNPAHLQLVTHQENCKRRKRSGPLPKAVRRA